MQAFYGLIAMAIVALVGLTMQRSINGNQQRIVVNEVATDLSGVAVEVLEHIGSKAFDARTDTNKVTVFPAVTSASQLTSPTDATEWGACTNYQLCEDIDDFDGMMLTRNRDGLEYQITIDVEYVDPDNPDTPSGKSYAKAVEVAVSNPYMKVGSSNTPLTVNMYRVFTYQRSTKTP